MTTFDKQPRDDERQAIMKWHRRAAWAALVVMVVAIGMRIAFNDKSYLNLAVAVLLPVFIVSALMTERELKRRGMTWRDLWE